MLEDWAATEEKNSRSPRRRHLAGAALKRVLRHARKVDPGRLDGVERQAARLGPFIVHKIALMPSVRVGPGPHRRNPEMEISMVGELELSEEARSRQREVRDRQATFEDGSEREIRYPADDEKPPTDRKAEWILTIRGQGAYWLRQFSDLRPGASNGSGS